MKRQLHRRKGWHLCWLLLVRVQYMTTTCCCCRCARRTRSLRCACIRTRRRLPAASAAGCCRAPASSATPLPSRCNAQCSPKRLQSSAIWSACAQQYSVIIIATAASHQLHCTNASTQHIHRWLSDTNESCSCIELTVSLPQAAVLEQANRLFALVSEANSVLSDPVRRQEV